jgi:adenylate kinase
VKHVAEKKAVVICTSQPGTGRDRYLQELKKKKDFFYYHLFEYIVEEAKQEGYVLSTQNVLDFYDSKPNKLESFRAKALAKIIKEIKEKEGIHVISTPYHFEWKGKSYTGLRKDEVEALDPDLFLVIIDDIVRVKGRLKQDPQWGEHKFTLVELSQWRREEIRGVYDLSRSFTPYKNFFLVARENEIDFLEELIFMRHKSKVYLSHPITGESRDFFEKIRQFASILRPCYTIFDPSMIKDWEMVETWRNVRNKAIREGKETPKKIRVTIDYAEGKKDYELDSWDIEAAIKNLRAQIIDIDYKIIESCNSTIAYNPREQLSAGVMCEMVYSMSLAKFVYAYYPFEPSPFFEWYTTKIFSNEKRMIKYLTDIAK